MMTILNTLRTTPQTLGIFKVAAMAGPSDADCIDRATDVFFREKALWQFQRGWRMNDLRRLVRQYGRTQDKVFPSGNFTRNGSPSGQYGTRGGVPGRGRRVAATRTSTAASIRRRNTPRSLGK